MKSLSLSAVVTLLGSLSLAFADSPPIATPGNDGVVGIAIRAPDASNPDCVFTCLDQCTEGQTTCEKGDTNCICTNDLTRATLQTCVATDCAPAEIPNANQYLKWACAGNWAN